MKGKRQICFGGITQYPIELPLVCSAVAADTNDCCCRANKEGTGSTGVEEDVGVKGRGTNVRI